MKDVMLLGLRKNNLAKVESVKGYCKNLLGKY